MRACISTNNDFFITDALELIEDDGANQTVLVADGDHESEDEGIEFDSEQKAGGPAEVQYVETTVVPKVMWDVETVHDWSKRIANYSAAQREFYNNMVPKIAELKNIVASRDGWNLLVDMKQDNLKIELKKSVRGLTICRGQGTIDWPVLDIWRSMCCSKYKQEWDINNDSCAFKEKIGVNAYIYYSRTKPKMGFSARDFVLNYLVNVEEDGTLLVVACSQGCKYQMDEVHGVTRGDMPISGLMLVPNKNDPGKTYAYVINEVDLKTSLPGFLVRQAFKD